MKLIGYVEYYFHRLRGKFNLAQASQLLTRTSFSSTKTREILRLAGAQIGQNSLIRAPLLIEKAVKLEIGDDVFVNHGMTVIGNGRVGIGSHALLGPHVTLVTVNHPMDPATRKSSHTLITADVSIHENVWLGANVTVCAGVTIGANSVIGAGSVVTRNIAANTFAAGIPCTPKRTLDQDN